MSVGAARMSPAGIKAKNSGALRVRKDLHAYALAVSSVLLAVGAEAILAFVVRLSSLLPLFSVAVAASAAFGGVGPGLVATVMAGAGAAFLTQYSAQASDSVIVVLEPTLLTILVGIAVTVLITASRGRVQRANDAHSPVDEYADRLSTAVRAANLEFWNIDLAGTKLSRSEDLVGLLERSSSASGVPEHKIVAEDRIRVEHGLAVSLISRSPFTCECRVITPDAQVRWMSCSGTVVQNPTGQPVALVGISRDVTAWKTVVENEQCLRAISESRGFGIARLHRDGRIQDVNEHVCELTGFSREELIGRPFRELLYRPADEPTVAETKSADTQFVRKDGLTFWARHTCAPVPGNDGRPDSWVAVIEAPLEPKDNEIEARLRASEHRLQAVVSSVPFGFALVNAWGQIVIANAAHRRIWDVATAENERVPAKPLGWFPESGRPVGEGDWPVARALLGRTVVDELITIQTGDGSRSTMASSAAPVLDTEGRICGAVVLDRDISSRHMPDCALCNTSQRLHFAQLAGTVGLFDWDSTSKTLTWSGAPHGLGGLPDRDRTVEEWEALIHPEDVDRVRAAVKQAVVDQQIVAIEFRLLSGSGAPRSVSVTARLLRDGQGRVNRIVGVASDAGNLKRAQRDLQLVAALVDSSEDAIIGLTIDGTIQSWNPGAEEIFGYSAAEVIGRPVTTLRAEADSAETIDFLKRVAAGERVKNKETVAYRSDGRRVWLSVTLYPIRNESGEVVGISEVARDISASKRGERRIEALNRDLERRVRARTAQLEEANRMLESFVYTASHDLRAPLRTIQGLTQALVEDCAGMLDDNGKEYAQRIIEDTGRMDALIRDLLEYSRLTRRQLNTQELSLSAAIAETLREQATVIAESGADVRVDVGDIRVLAHELTLVQVLNNLISNAIKFVAPGVRPIIRISSETNGRRARVYVQDNGIGIDYKHQTRIFEVFERLYAANEYPGTGIGLAIVRKGIERLGGTVGVQSSLGKGSRFWFELPLAVGARGRE